MLLDGGEGLIEAADTVAVVNLWHLIQVNGFEG